MAIGAVVSHRNFGSFLASGKVYQEPLFPGYRRYSCRNSFGSSNSETLRARLTYQDESEHPNVLHQQFANKFLNIKHSQRTRAICECYLLSRKLGKLGIVDNQFQQSKHATVIRTRAGYKSEDYDITGEGLESLVSSEGASEAILVEAVQQTKPWWELPKRWVIVLLCFTAFLLCNMDRVNMSIAILPMSKEFNWNSATVGLIQSSFFWGYLLTQVFTLTSKE